MLASPTPELMAAQLEGRPKDRPVPAELYPHGNQHVRHADRLLHSAFSRPAPEQ